MGFAAITKADTVELNLFNLGCPTVFDINSPYWQTNFDLGVTFSEISHVYIDWSGKITAGLAVHYTDPCNPIPLDVSINTYLDMPIHALSSVWGGQDNYPAPESFENQSNFLLWGTWSGLLDGCATIWVYYGELIVSEGRYIESGSIVLDNAALIFDGVIIPEPASILLLGLGALLSARTYKQKPRKRPYII